MLICKNLNWLYNWKLNDIILKCKYILFLLYAIKVFAVLKIQKFGLYEIHPDNSY